jgi:hypothetical protein
MISPDPVDQSDMSELMDSPAWKLVAARLKVMLERHRDGCERSETEMELRRAQGAVAALRAALLVPQILWDELATGR